MVKICYHLKSNEKCLEKKVLTKSGLEWKRNSKFFFYPIAPLGGSSNAMNAISDNTSYTTFNFKNKKTKMVKQDKVINPSFVDC